MTTVKQDRDRARDRQRERQLAQRLARIQRALLALGDLRPGTLSVQYNVCGTPGCRCKADPPVKHGPYYQVSYTRRGKSSTTFVRPGQVAAVKRQIRTYHRLRELMEDWIDVGAELARLRMAAGAAKERPKRR